MAFVGPLDWEDVVPNTESGEKPSIWNIGHKNTHDERKSTCNFNLWYVKLMTIKKQSVQRVNFVHCFGLTRQRYSNIRAIEASFKIRIYPSTMFHALQKHQNNGTREVESCLSSTKWSQLAQPQSMSPCYTSHKLSPRLQRQYHAMMDEAKWRLWRICEVSWLCFSKMCISCVLSTSAFLYCVISCDNVPLALGVASQNQILTNWFLLWKLLKTSEDYSAMWGHWRDMGTSSSYCSQRRYGSVEAKHLGATCLGRGRPQSLELCSRWVHHHVFGRFKMF